MNFVLVMNFLLSSTLAFGLYARGEPLWGCAALVAVLCICGLTIQWMRPPYAPERRNSRGPWYAP